MIGVNLAHVRHRMALACEAAGRAPGAVRLIAVSKTFGAEQIAQAIAAGQTEFGESYLQEALPKMAAVAQLTAVPLTWHFIGPVQSNKTRDIAAHFDWVHGVDRLKVATRLSDQRPEERGPLQVCVQVNISGEPSKSGCRPEEAAALCRQVARLPRLCLRGLMAVPAAEDQAGARRAFAALRELFEAIGRELPALDTLSAGMSDDLEAAIAEGSTQVRIGSAIFGMRR